MKKDVIITFTILYLFLILNSPALSHSNNPSITPSPTRISPIPTDVIPSPFPTPTSVETIISMIGTTNINTAVDSGDNDYHVMPTRPTTGGHATNTPTPSPTPKVETTSSNSGTGVLANTGANLSTLFQSMFGVTPTPTKKPILPSSTPIPTPVPPSPTVYVALPTPSIYIPSPFPTRAAPTLIPTFTLNRPTLPPILPTSKPIIPLRPPISKEITKDNKTESFVDKTKVGGILIVPAAFAAEPAQKQSLLPQEQKSAAPVSGGIIVTLEQKTGEAYVTQQDQLTVKRGDQFFSISNQQQNTPGDQANTTSSPPQLQINANNVIAYSDMGLSVDPLSGILTVQTPTGPQRVSIMPDEALGIVIELKALNAKGVVEPSIQLVSESGSLIYRISGERVEKILGLFPLPIKKQVLISADTGSVVKVELSFLSQILSLLTF